MKYMPLTACQIIESWWAFPTYEGLHWGLPIMKIKVGVAHVSVNIKNLSSVGHHDMSNTHHSTIMPLPLGMKLMLLGKKKESKYPGLLHMLSKQLKTLQLGILASYIICSSQFSFMLGRSTMKVIFALRQLIENTQERGRNYIWSSLIQRKLMIKYLKI